jgi:UDP-2,3-diacylglucosamine hydrolase
LSTLFVSDLHLDAAWPDVTTQFIAFLRREARVARALYILGDLFEVWIGARCSRRCASSPPPECRAS